MQLARSIECGCFSPDYDLNLVWKEEKNIDNSRKRPIVNIFLARLKIGVGFDQVTSGIIEGFGYVEWRHPKLL